MKTKTLLILASSALLIAACGNPTPTPTPTPSSESSSSLTTSSSSSETSTSSTEVIEHLGDYTGVSAEAELRDFDERFDAPVEDFSGENLAGVTDGVRHNGYLRALVDSQSDNFPKTTDGAIYKAASGTYEAMGFGANGIGFRMRVSRGKVALANLRLELRGGDGFQTYQIQLSEARNSDNEALPELSGEFQDFLINPGQTIEDETTVYKNLDGTDSETAVLGMILGFHLVANDVEVGGELEIAEVFTYQGTTRTVLDDFNRTDVARVPNAWWGGSASGFIVRKGVKLEGGKAYTTPSLSGESHLVLTALGDSSSTTLVGLDASGAELATLSWSEAHGVSGTLAALATGAYGNYVIDLDQLAGNGVLDKVKVLSTSAVELAGVFLTSMEVPNLDLTYPHIAPTVVVDDFDREIASLNDNWEASAQLQANIDAGVTGFVSYSMGDQISVSNGHLNLPATDNYAQVTIGYQANHVDAKAKYVVIAAKGDDLNRMRFKFRGQGNDTEVWFNSGLAAEGVKAYGDAEVASPYVDSDGFTHYVFDLALNGLGAGDLFDLYYTGPSAVQIESIYYANDDFSFSWGEGADPAVSTEVDLANYSYGGGIAIAPNQLFGVSINSAAGDADFSSFRVQMGGEFKWLNNGSINAYYMDGSKVSPTDKIPESGTVILFDLSVFSEDVEHYLHLHVGDGFTGRLTLGRLLVGNRGFSMRIGGGDEVAVDHGYAYLCGMDIRATFEELQITVKASGENMTYECFRIESPQGVLSYFNNPETVAVYHADGTRVAGADVIPEEGETLTLSIADSAIAPAPGGALHFHYGDWGNPVGTIQVVEVRGLASVTPYELVKLVK